MLSCRLVRVAVLVGSPFLAGAAARAGDKDCTGYDALKDRPAIASGKVAGSGARVPLVKNGTDDEACPAATDACRRKAFLVPGDGVLVSGRAGAFACVTFVNGKGVETDGWLPDAALAMDAPPAGPAAPDWVGTWIREEAEVTIKAGGQGAVSIHGDATFGAKDPRRVRNGAVNIGEISGVVSPTGDRLSFAMDDGKTLPLEKDDDGACKVWMRRSGGYLLVNDNNACGGMNVSFRGTYVRR